MSQPTLGVVAVGNALVDVLAKVSDDFLENQIAQYGMEKGAMTLIDETRAVELYTQLEGCVETSGGSGGNTMAGYASFGGKGGFIGKVADDELGKVFQKDLRDIGIKFDTQPLIMGAKTGRCIILVTPDAERTMNTFLGASVELKAEDIDEDLIAQAAVTYLEGYLFDKEKAKHAFIKAAEAAHKNGHRVSLTLSDPFCVDRHRSDFLRLVESHIDILFANEDEIKSLFLQEDLEDAISAVSENVEIAAITRGADGATIISDGKRIDVPAAPVDNVVDTTGAGDQFAAGFLYGFTNGRTLETAGKLGALAASEVISHIGPRPEIALTDLISKAA